MEAWEELDALAEELRATNAVWQENAAALHQQIDALRPDLDALEDQFVALQIGETLRELCRRLLNDAGRVHAVRMEFGILRSVALTWESTADPRQAGEAAAGQYSIDVRIGPRYLLGIEPAGATAPDLRLSILIAGEKQLVATLPTTTERFRAAVLRAFRAPKFTEPPQEQGSDAEAAEPFERDAGSTDPRATATAAEAPPADGNGNGVTREPGMADEEPKAE